MAERNFDYMPPIPADAGEYRSNRTKGAAAKMTGTISEAIVVLAKCSQEEKLYGIRAEKRSDGQWWRNWAFPINEVRANKEGYLSSVTGRLKASEEYPGCPHCGSKRFMQCDTCGKLSCYHGESQITCPWCKTKITSLRKTREFAVKGGDI